MTDEQVGTGTPNAAECNHRLSEALQDGLIGGLTDVQQEYIGDIFTSRKTSVIPDQRHPRSVQGRGRHDGARTGTGQHSDL